MKFHKAALCAPLLLAGAVWPAEPAPGAADETAGLVRTVAKPTKGPQLISKPRLFYPPVARQANAFGPVQVEMRIGKNGQVREAHAVSGPYLLRTFAEDAVRHWRFRPALVDKMPVEAPLSVTLNYRLAH
jgi:outer membrane biosynthesis protein TonB